MQHKKLLSLAVSSALGLTASLMVTGVAVAQDQDQDENAEDLLEEVIVTGSRIATVDGFGRTSPVTVIGMDEIESTGLTRVEDILNSLPQVETGLHSFDANGISGTASIDLRGLGANRTLVLMNGRRFPPGGVSAQAVDVNQIPSALIERVEVLTGGASATYGADAVAGVVNFIMRRVQGVEISGGISGYQHHNDNKFIQGLMDLRGFEYPTGGSGIDGQAYNIEVAIGSDFADGRGNATVYGTWRNNQELLQGKRDYSSCALSADSESCGGSANAIVPNFFIAPAGNGISDYSRSEFLSMQTGGALEPWDGTNRYNYAPVNHFMRPDERWSLGAFVDYEINEHAIAYFEGNFTNDRTVGQIAESGTFFAAEYYLPQDNSLFPPIFVAGLKEFFDNQYCHEYSPVNDNACVDVNNSPLLDGDGDPSVGTPLDGLGGQTYIQDSDDPTTGEFIPFNDYGVYIGKRNVEGGPRRQSFNHDAFRVVTGLKGAINDDWDYDFSYLYAASNSSQSYENDMLTARIGIAVDGESCDAVAGCIPYEVFTYQGVTPEAAAALLGTAISTGHTSTRVINGYVTGDTGWNIGNSDSIMVAAGWEHRTETYERVSDTTFQTGALAGQGGPTVGVSGSYNVLEFFAEGNIPLLSNVTGAQALNLDLAYRYSDYSTSGGSSTYRIGFNWQPIDLLNVRVGYNRAVRAPNVSELFSTQSLGLWSGVDPCATADPVMTEAQCLNQGVSPAQYGTITESPAGQYNAIFGGNPLLDPEVADTWTAGMVINPMDTLTISVDYWNIKIDDTINNIGATTILDQCGLNGVLCDLVVRNAGGSLWQGTQGFVVDTTLNLGQAKWEGIDLAFNWTIEGWGGTWTTNMIGTYMMNKETTPLPSSPDSAYDCTGLISTRCFPTPKWRHTWATTYDSNEWWSITARWRYFKGVDYDGDTDTIAQSEMSSDQNYIDLSARFLFLENHDITIGVNNVFDKEPPMVGDSLTTNANTIAGYYDTLGRYLFANATFRF